jgi:hypothetical protein
LKEIGVDPVIADALDAAAVKAAVGRIRPNAVINEFARLQRCRRVQSGHGTPWWRVLLGFARSRRQSVWDGSYD